MKNKKIELKSMSQSHSHSYSESHSQSYNNRNEYEYLNENTLLNSHNNNSDNISQEYSLDDILEKITFGRFHLRFSNFHNFFFIIFLFLSLTLTLFLYLLNSFIFLIIFDLF